MPPVPSLFCFIRILHTFVSLPAYQVWPNGFPETFCTRHWRCRFRSTRPLDATEATEKHQTEGLNPTDLNTVVRAVTAVERHGLDLIKMENLYVFDGKPGFSLGQGE